MANNSLDYENPSRRRWFGPGFGIVCASISLAEQTALWMNYPKFLHPFLSNDAGCVLITVLWFVALVLPFVGLCFAASRWRVAPVRATVAIVLCFAAIAIKITWTINDITSGGSRW